MCCYRLISNFYFNWIVIGLVCCSELGDVENFVEKFGIETLCARDKHGYTPAHWVALDGNVDMMRYLVGRKAPVDLRCLGTQGPRPIHWACRKGHAGMEKYFYICFIIDEINYSLLSAVVQVLLQAGVSVNAADLKGLTPLMTACVSCFKSFFISINCIHEFFTEPLCFVYRCTGVQRPLLICLA